jgi:hypothetical protein
MTPRFMNEDELSVRLPWSSYAIAQLAKKTLFLMNSQVRGLCCLHHARLVAPERSTFGNEEKNSSKGGQLERNLATHLRVRRGSESTRYKARKEAGSQSRKLADFAVMVTQL